MWTCSPEIGKWVRPESVNDVGNGKLGSGDGDRARRKIPWPESDDVPSIFVFNVFYGKALSAGFCDSHFHLTRQKNN
jgi:hypothetical protein